MTNHNQILDNLIQEITKKFSLIPYIGMELEFFLLNYNPSFADDLILISKNSGIFLNELEKEKGDNQFEIQLPFTNNLLQICTDIEKIKEIMIVLAQKYQINLILNAKPFSNQPGNSLHIHLHFADQTGNNVFSNPHSNFFEKTIASLLYYLNESMIFFAPEASCYSRYQDIKSLAPTHLSWGGNNRTTCLRIPHSKPQFKRIEHRVPSSIANPFASVICILASCLAGFEQQLPNYPRIYGNAFDEQYNLPPLVNSLAQAQECYKNGSLIKYYLNPSNS